VVLLPRERKEEGTEGREGDKTGEEKKRRERERKREIESLGKVDFEDLLVEKWFKLCFEGFFGLPADLIALFKLQVVHLQFDRFDPHF